MPLPRLLFVLVMLLLALPTTGCQSVYYGTMEKLGWHKRDLLVSRVEDARDEQQEAKEEFQTALDEFTALVGYDGGDLRAVYDRLNTQLESCAERAREVNDRIDSIESVAADLFTEWETELEQYTSADLKRRSQQQLSQTRTRCAQLVGAMRRAARKMDPVLVAFQDQVLFLKHNLNAQAVASLQGEVVGLESNVADLVSEMEAAIAEADAFIASMSPETA